MSTYRNTRIYQTKWKVWKDGRLVSYACSFMGALHLKNTLLQEGSDPVTTFITKERIFPPYTYLWPSGMGM